VPHVNLNHVTGHDIMLPLARLDQSQGLRKPCPRSKGKAEAGRRSPKACPAQGQVTSDLPAQPPSQPHLALFCQLLFSLPFRFPVAFPVFPSSHNTTLHYLQPWSGRGREGLTLRRKSLSLCHLTKKMKMRKRSELNAPHSIAHKLQLRGHCDQHSTPCSEL
jgi:hypothetical protein